MLSVLKDMQVSRPVNETAAGTSEIDGSILDMSGYDSVVFIALLGTVTSGSVMTLKGQQNSANSTSGMADITGSSASLTDAGSSSNQVMISEVMRPSLRYVRPVFLRTTQNAEVNGIVAIQFNSRNVPQTQPAVVIASALAAPLG